MAPAGALVHLRYDWPAGHGQPPGEGDFLISTGGSAYEILDARPTRGRAQRLNLRCVKLEGRQSIPTGVRVEGIRWYSRNRKGRR